VHDVDGRCITTSVFMAEYMHPGRRSSAPRRVFAVEPITRCGFLVQPSPPSPSNPGRLSVIKSGGANLQVRSLFSIKSLLVCTCPSTIRDSCGRRGSARLAIHSFIFQDALYFCCRFELGLLLPASRSNGLLLAFFTLSTRATHTSSGRRSDAYGSARFRHISTGKKLAW